MMDQIMMSSITIEELISQISERVRKDLSRDLHTTIDNITSLPERPTIKQAAKYLGVSVPTVYDKINQGLLTIDKLGSRSRLRRSEVINLLKKVEQ